MINKSNTILFLFILALITGIVDNKLKNDQENGQYKALKTIESLELINLKIEKLVFNAFQSQSYDALANLTIEFNNTVNILDEALKKYKYEDSYIKLLNDIKKDSKILNEEVERFKSINGVLNNSIRYSFDLKVNLINKKDYNLKKFLEIDKALDYISMLNYITKTSLEELKLISRNIKKWPNQTVEESLFAKHIDIVVDKTIELDSIQQTIKKLELESKLDNIHIKSFDFFKKSKKSNNILTNILYFLTLVFGIILFYFYRKNLKYNKELEEMKNNLEMLVEERTSELKLALKKINKSKEIAINAAKSKSEFLANMSHEIRTPMNAIVGMSFLISQTDLNGTQYSYIKKIENASNHLLAVINDILDYSKIEAGKMTLESIEFKLDEILENISDMFIFQVEEKNIELIFDKDSTIPNILIGDPLRFSQVLINIISNAIKFTEKGKVVLKIKLTKKYDDKVSLQFCVSDTGIGMNEKHLSKLFTTYSQADSSTTRKYGGSGLGLTICKHIIDLMHGKIKVESIYGKGSDFIIDLEFNLQDNQKLLIDNLNSKPNIKILIIDNNFTVGESLQQILKSFHFNADFISNLEEAFEVLEHSDEQNIPYDLVLLDYDIPNVTETGVLLKIKNQLKLKKQPKIVLIASDDKNDIKNKIDKNLIEYILIKPISPSTLFDTTVKLFNDKILNKSQYSESSKNYLEYAAKIEGIHILLVEDNIENQRIAIEYLKKAKVTVDIAQNGEECINKVLIEKYDIILMDCQMPILDGFAATKSIRKVESIKDVIIIAMTANSTNKDKEKCINSGMNDYISKPIDITKFFETLAKWTKTKQLVEDKFIVNKNVINFEKYKQLHLNVRQAIMRMGDDEELFLSHLKRFTSSQSSFQQGIEEYISNNDIESFIRHIHTLKGLLGSVGAEILYINAKNLEVILKNEGLSEIAQKEARKIGINLENLLERINLFLNTLEKKEEKKEEFLTFELFQIHLKTLKKLLIESDVEALKQIKIIEPSLIYYGFEKESLKLINDIELLEFEEALDIIKKIELSLL